MKTASIVTLPLEVEDDIVHARRCARVVAEHLGLRGQDQTRVATAVSEIARNAFGYAGNGKVDFMLCDEGLMVRVADRGSGIDHLPRILEGRYQSKTGMGLGITGARRLMDAFNITTSPSGTMVTMSKTLPPSDKPLGTLVLEAADAIRNLRSSDRLVAARDENRDLIESLTNLAEREEEARRLNLELAETNRGVVALHAELERQAEELRRAGETLERQVTERTRELAEANVRLRAEAEARERVEADLRQSQKMEAVGQLTGGIAHDFNNLLTGVVGSLDLMQRRLKQGRHEKLDAYIEMALGSAHRAAALTHRLLAFARRQPLDPKIVGVNELIDGMHDLLRRTVNEAIELHLALDPAAWSTLCDPFQLENAILNLAINARDAMPSGGRIIVSTRNETIASADPGGVLPGDYVITRVADTGIGMPPDVIARAFDPFFTTKPLGQGTGLGLSMIYGFAKQSEGDARIRSAPGGGTTIDILLPRHEGIAARVAAAGVAEPSAGHGETVLVVEDEGVIRNLLLEGLAEAGYRVIHAKDGTGGLEAARKVGQLDLVVTDVGLPGMNGRQLVDALREQRPRLKVLFITGYADFAASPTASLDRDMAMMTKPFVLGKMLGRVRDILDDVAGGGSKSD